MTIKKQSNWTLADSPCLIQLTCLLNIKTGTVALLFKPHAIPSVKVTSLQIFRAFRAFSGQK
jgi:hypothetical protein